MKLSNFFANFFRQNPQGLGQLSRQNPQARGPIFFQNPEWWGGYRGPELNDPLQLDPGE